MIKTEGNIRISYKHYRKVTTNAINSLKIYIDINNHYMKFLISKVLDGHTITLPERLGTLDIRGRKVMEHYDNKGNLLLPVDYAETKKLWKRCPECEAKKQVVRHLNLHSDGIGYRYFWSKRNILLENKEFYSLKMSRANKRAVPKLISEGVRYSVKK
jgi:hypothetical protein